MGLDSQMFGAMAQVATALQGIKKPGAVLYMLKRDGQTMRYSGTQLTSGWMVELDGIRDRFQFKYATTDTDFRDMWAESTHIGYGVPNDDDEIEVFEIDPEQKDNFDPEAFSPFWQCMAVKVPNERFATA